MGCEGVASLANKSVYIDPAWTTPHRPASYFHRYKLVFHLQVTITIKGETQMGSVSNKDSMGY